MTIKSLRALERQATPGPWVNDLGPDPDAALIAAARNALPALLAVAEAAADYVRLFHQDVWVDDEEYEDHDDNLQSARLALRVALAELEATP